ncbi:TonB-dependent receptor [Methylotenera versatilis]|uniref:TonB-dependent receptor n=1 Tax=Methylotenera versatilis (strain 301) TaxID=666681 RepID=D7DIX0_METV0|nr:TonB-dependent receptor [Methylotenera versatilis]ADI30005.1 TonB-dependent receptor [Methylotenera versatilis 301]
MQISLQQKNMKPKLILVAILSAYAMPQIAMAENKAEVLELSKVEVVGTTPLPSIGTPINQVPSNVQTGSSKQFDQQQSLDLSEYLDNNLGSVNTSNSVANPYQADVQFRGFTASPLLGTPQGLSVYMDGVRVNEAFGDIVNWDLIPANAIANINLIPGSNPLFGLNTLGGALAVHTKSGAEFPGIKATVYGGSWARRAFEFEAGGEDKEKNLDYFVAGNIFKENGWREHSSSDVKQVFGKVGWQNDTSDLDLSVALADTMMEGTQAVPLSSYNQPKKAYTYPDSIGNQLFMVNLKGSHFLTDDKLVAGNVYYRKNKSTGFNSNAESIAPSDSLNISTNTNQDGFGGALQMTLLGDLAGHKNQFTVGASADFGRTDFTSDSMVASIVGNETVTDDPTAAPTAFVRLKARNDYYGLYATDTFSYTDKLHLTLSGRYNVAKVNLSGTTHDDNATPVDFPLEGNHHYSRFNPAIGLNYNPSTDLGFYGGYNEGMRAATPVELSCAEDGRPCSLPNAFAADPHLEKVVAKTWEGGVRGKLASSLNWNMGLYTTENSDDIQFIASSTPTLGYFKNVGETRRRGFELGLNGKFDALTLAVNYGFVDATYQSDFTVGSPANSSKDGLDQIQVSKGDKIPGIARQTLKLRAAYDVTPAWSVGTNIVLAAGQYARGDENNQDANGRVPGYAVVHLDTHYSINNNWKLFAKLNNVFDTQYATFGVLGNNIFNGLDEQFRSPAAPRAGWVGVTYEFGRSKTASAAVDAD